MGQTILGLDIGAKSIKAVKISSSFKKMEFLGAREIPFPANDQDHTSSEWEERVAAAAATLLSDPQFSAEVIITAIPGTRVTSRITELPFSDPRMIDQILYAELEGTLPFNDLQDVVIDYQIAKVSENGGAHILVAAAHKEQITSFLSGLRNVGVNPRVVSITGLSQSGLMSQVVRRSPDKAPTEWPVAVVDMGHEQTTVSIMNKESTLLWRTFQFGGRNLIEAVAEKLGLEHGQAEKLIAGLTTIGRPADSASGITAPAPISPSTPPPQSPPPIPLPNLVGELSISDQAESAISGGGNDNHGGSGSTSTSASTTSTSASTTSTSASTTSTTSTTSATSTTNNNNNTITMSVQAAVRDALAILLRNLRQTLMSMDSIYSDDTFEIFLTGGVSKLKGLRELLEEQLSVKVRNLNELYSGMFLLPTADKRAPKSLADNSQCSCPCPVDSNNRDDWGSELTAGSITIPANTTATLEEQLVDPRFAEALALTMRQMAAAGNVPRIDLRKGEMGYKGDFQYLRGKILSISVALITILAALGLLAASRFSLLRSEETALIAELKAKSELVFGKELTDFDTAARMVTIKPNQKNRFNIPTVNAYDLFYEISNRIGEDIVVDLEMLEIDRERNKVEMRGRTDSATSVETISDRLQSYPCFKKVDRDRNEKGTDGKQLFVLSIDTEC